ncbi:hypothetical protein HGRIS_000639 [Hohenbuehelia grisea]|uniref:Ser-Thr-rich glycosyl-phosphatidyl-inositol-anchored membrane family-domain-containing protein n=1 Tax=Hohenbuehelia grisea TaxID=104357 RepID=A0ABR3JTM6_9AGAR
MVKLVTLVAAVSAFVGSAAAAVPFQIYTPGPNNWWVAKSQNILAWTCNDAPAQSYTVMLKIPGQASPLPIIAIVKNDACSIVIPEQVNQAAQGGYTIQLADTLNSTKVFAESQPFEIKALGAAYPATTASAPGATAGAGSGSGNGSGSGSGSAAAPTASQSGQSGQNGAASLQSMGIWAALAGVFLGVIA